MIRFFAFVFSICIINSVYSLEKINCSLDEIKKELNEKLKINNIPNKLIYKPIIAIIDTGINPYNEELIKNVFIPEIYSFEKGYGIDLTNKKITNTPIDTHGHGSHVAGIVLALNPYAQIFPIKYYDEKLKPAEGIKNFIKAIEIAINSNVDIITIAGGGKEPSSEEKSLLIKARNKGILVVSAMGNERTNIDFKPYYPAYYNLDNFINVMSHDDKYNTSSFSNWGKFAHISTFGNNIKSFSSTDDCVTLNGTSMSTAIISGISSLIKTIHPDYDYKKIKSVLNSHVNKDKKIINYQAIFNIKGN